MNKLLASSFDIVKQFICCLRVRTNPANLRICQFKRGACSFSFVEQKIPKLDAVFVFTQVSLQSSYGCLNTEGMWTRELLKGLSFFPYRLEKRICCIDSDDVGTVQGDQSFGATLWLSSACPIQWISA